MILGSKNSLWINLFYQFKKNTMLKTLLQEIDASPKNLKQFAWLFAIIGIVIVPGIIFYKHQMVGNAAIISASIGLVSLLVGLIRFQLLSPIYKAWMLLALVLDLVLYPLAGIPFLDLG